MSRKDQTFPGQYERRIFWFAMQLSTSRCDSHDAATGKSGQ